MIRGKFRKRISRQLNWRGDRKFVFQGNWVGENSFAKILHEGNSCQLSWQNIFAKPTEFGESSPAKKLQNTKKLSTLKPFKPTKLAKIKTFMPNELAKPLVPNELAKSPSKPFDLAKSPTQAKLFGEKQSLSRVGDWARTATPDLVKCHLGCCARRPNVHGKLVMGNQSHLPLCEHTIFRLRSMKASLEQSWEKLQKKAVGVWE